MINAFVFIPFILLFLGPYLILLVQFSLSFETPFVELIQVLKNTIIQAVSSGVLSVMLGVLGGLGLLWLGRTVSSRAYFWIEKAILLPNIIPSLFVILSCLVVIQPFPFGQIGIILIHTLMNIGLISILFRRICLNKLGMLMELSLIEGASSWHFFKVAVLGYLKMDLIYLFIFVFAISMVSFNVPYMIGGPSGTTLEVLIFEKIIITQRWSEAIGLSFIQMALIGFVSYLSQQMNWNWGDQNGQANISLIEWKWGLIFPVLAVMIIFYSPLASVVNGIRQLESLNFSLIELFEPIFNSLKIGLLGGLTIFLLALIACYGFDSIGIKLISKYFISPGPVLLGFSVYLMQSKIGAWDFSSKFNFLDFQLIFGLSIMFFWTLFRLSLASPMQSLSKQIEVAQVLGASQYSIFSKIIFPQIITPITFMCGVASMWFCGDFAFSKLISPGDFHLALIVKSLASSYRLDAAQLLMVILYILSLVLFILWWSLGNVLSRKFKI